MYTKWSMEKSSKQNPDRDLRTAKQKPFRLRIWMTAMICTALVITSACGLLPEEQQLEEIPVITPPTLSERPEYTVQTGTIESRVRGVGKIMSMQEEELFFTLEDTTLRVQDTYVQSGNYVEKGALIAELDVSELNKQLRSMRLQFRNDELEMIRTLRRKNELSPEEFEQAQIDFEEKRTELLELEERIERARLRAPFSGTIVSISIKPGDTVQAYDTVAVIADLNRLTVAADMDSKDLEKVAVGMEVSVDINNFGQHVGTVSRLPASDDTDQQNNYYPGYPGNEQERESIDDFMLVELESFPEQVTRGTPLSVVIVTDRREDVVLIPPSTLNSYGGRTYVQVVEEDGTRREVDVEVGQQTSTQVEIISGLEPGQKVVGR